MKEVRQIKCGLRENNTCGNYPGGYGLCGFCRFARSRIYGLLKGELAKGKGGDEIIIDRPYFSLDDTLVGRYKRGIRTLASVRVKKGKVTMRPKKDF